MHTPSTSRQGPHRNLGTYSNVISDTAIHDVLLSAAEMNFVDKAAYPEVVAMEQATISFLLQALHGDTTGTGLATTGSSEAIILALAWHLRNFRATSSDTVHQKRLNFVVSEGYHKSFEKLSHLFDVELRPIPLNTQLRADITKARRLVDENTFCIVGIAGSTELGMVDDIYALNKLAKEHHLPLHVDAAAGGYILPFLDNIARWDFSLSNVQSINVSAHKYGLCLPGIGFLLLRDASIISKGYSGKIDYLSGGSIIDNALTCTRNAAFVVNAYQNTQHYGTEGYTKFAHTNARNAYYLATKLEMVQGVTHVIRGDMPVVTFSHEDIEGLSHYLSTKGWTQSPHVIKQMGRYYIRVVVRKHVDEAMLREFLQDVISFSTSTPHISYSAPKTRSTP